MYIYSYIHTYIHGCKRVMGGYICMCVRVYMRKNYYISCKLIDMYLNGMLPHERTNYKTRPVSCDWKYMFADFLQHTGAQDDSNI